MSHIREQFCYRGVTYQLRNVLCGKNGCGKCPHGPYWYAIVTITGKKPAVRYVGKQLKGPALDYYTTQRAMEVEPE
jgi:hypothetical protein